MIFGEVPVLSDENCHGLGKRGKGEREERKEREKRKAEQMLCRRGDGPAVLCDVLNECYVQSVGPNLQLEG